MTKCEGGGASAVRAAVLEWDSATEKELAAGANLKWECVCFSSDEYNLFAESPANARIGQCLFIRKPNNYSKQIKIRQLCDFFITLQKGQKFRLFYFILFFYICSFVGKAFEGLLNARTVAGKARSQLSQRSRWSWRWMVTLIGITITSMDGLGSVCWTCVIAWTTMSLIVILLHHLPAHGSSQTAQLCE